MCDTQNLKKVYEHIYFINVIIIIIIIIKEDDIMDSPLSLSHSLFAIICSYQPLLFVSLLGGIKCPHRADRYKVLMVSQHWCVHV